MAKKQPWQTGKPPNGVIVEVKDGQRIRRIQAIYGRDGTLPHWESEDDFTSWSPNAFTQWREVKERSSNEKRRTCKM